MKILRATDDPETLAVTEVSAPTADAGRLVVEVEAFAINPTDLLRLRAPGSTWSPGVDVVGRVVAVATDGLGPAVGDRVVAASLIGGGAGERLALPVSDVALVPPDVAVADLAGLPLPGLTALRLLRQAGPIDGQKVVVSAAGGAVGHFLIQLARRAGAEVTAVASPAHHERLRALGAARTVPNLNDLAPDAEPTGVNVVFDGLGGVELEAAIARSAPNARVLWFGASADSALNLDFYAVAGGSRGLALHHFVWVTGDPIGADLAELADLLSDGDIVALPADVRHWDAAPEIVRGLIAGEVRGKVVLMVA